MNLRVHHREGDDGLVAPGGAEDRLLRSLLLQLAVEFLKEHGDGAEKFCAVCNLDLGGEDVLQAALYPCGEEMLGFIKVDAGGMGRQPGRDVFRGEQHDVQGLNLFPVVLEPVDERLNFGRGECEFAESLRQVLQVQKFDGLQSGTLKIGVFLLLPGVLFGSPLFHPLAQPGIPALAHFLQQVFAALIAIAQ